MSDFFNLVSSSAGMIAFFVALAAGMFIIPFGLPGTFLQIAATLALAAATGGALMAWHWVILFLVLALMGEGIEFLSGQWGARKFGGSKQAAWGAIIGGLCGALFGGALIPIPIVGSLIASFIGTFSGAIIGQMREENSKAPNLRVGMGAVIGRAIGVGVKMFIALVIAISSVAVVMIP
ncbi:MAG TPA: DUF456 domain-containing protein [Planctomycetota bacterium]|nr:DUF456 domain-containing protein [Planctomycetota bacterium]